MKQYTLGNQPKRNTGYWTQAAGYLYWHKTAEAAQAHAAQIQWTNASVWNCKTGEAVEESLRWYIDQAGKEVA